MLQRISFLLFGDETRTDIAFDHLRFCLAINNHYSKLDHEKKQSSSDHLEFLLLRRIDELKLSSFLPIVQRYIELLRTDDAMLLYVLFMTSMIDDVTFEKSLIQRSVKNCHATSLGNGSYLVGSYISPPLFDGVPFLPWDISQANVILDDQEPREEITTFNATNDRGDITTEYHRCLMNRELMDSVRNDVPLVFIQVSMSRFTECLLTLHAGTSSEVFIKDSKNWRMIPVKVDNFSRCQIASVYERHVQLANRIQQTKDAMDQLEETKLNVVQSVCFKAFETECWRFWRKANNLILRYERLSPSDVWQISRSHHWLLELLVKWIVDPSITLIGLHERLIIHQRQCLTHSESIKLTLNLVTKSIVSELWESLKSMNHQSQLFHRDDKRKRNNCWQVSYPVFSEKSSVLDQRHMDRCVDLVNVNCFRKDYRETFVLKKENDPLEEATNVSEEFIQKYLLSEEDLDLRSFMDRFLKETAVVTGLNNFMLQIHTEIINLYEFVHRSFAQPYRADIERVQVQELRRLAVKLSTRIDDADKFVKYITLQPSSEKEKWTKHRNLEMIVPPPLNIFFNSACSRIYAFLNYVVSALRGSQDAILEVRKKEIVKKEPKVLFYLNTMNSFISEIQIKVHQQIEQQWNWFWKSQLEIDSDDPTVRLTTLRKLYWEYMHKLRDAIFYADNVRPNLYIMLESVISTTKAIAVEDVVEAAKVYARFINMSQLFVQNLRANNYRGFDSLFSEEKDVEPHSSSSIFLSDVSL